MKSTIAVPLCLILGLVAASSGGSSFAHAASLSQPGENIRLTRSWDNGWLFSRRDSALAMMPGFDDSSWRGVRLPHDWSTEEPLKVEYGSGNGYVAAGVGWYRKHFSVDPALKDRLVIVDFDGIYNHSEVWVNGQFAGGRPYGYSSFELDVTRFADFGRDNVIAVRVDHSRYADSRFYTGSGIFRHVHLSFPDRIHIGHWGTAVTTPRVTTESATVELATDIVNAGPELATVLIRSEVSDSTGTLVGACDSSETLEGGQTVSVTQGVEVSHPKLWSVQSPTLYHLRSVLIRSGASIDGADIQFGIRTIAFDPGRGFLLNGESVKMKGVCIHHDAGSVGAAVPLGVLERRLRLLRELGVNAIRTSHNPPAPELLDLCDQMGFVVMDEAFDEFTPGKNKWVEGWTLGMPGHYGYAEDFAEWSVRDMEDLVRRDRNHPSVVLWSVGNEVDTPNDPYSDLVLGKDYRPQNPPASELVRLGAPLAAAVKRFDRTRPVTAAMASVQMSDAVGFADLLDVAGYNYQEWRYVSDHAKFPRRIIYGSENRHDYQAWAAVRDNDWIFGQFLWTGIDYLGEAGRWPNRASGSGLLDLCGFKKPLGWFRQSLWSGSPMVYIAARRGDLPAGSADPFQVNPALDRERRSRSQESWNWPVGSSVEVTCYSNCDAVQLTLNGSVISTKKSTEAAEGVLTWRVPYAPGMLKAVGLVGGKPAAEFALETTGPAARVELLPDRTDMPADGTSICHLEYRIVDSGDRRIADAEVPVTFRIDGPADVLGIGSGDLDDLENPHGLTHLTFEGRGMAILCSQTQTGSVHIKASAPGLVAADAVISVR